MKSICCNSAAGNVATITIHSPSWAVHMRHLCELPGGWRHICLSLSLCTYSVAITDVGPNNTLRVRQWANPSDVSTTHVLHYMSQRNQSLRAFVRLQHFQTSGGATPQIQIHVPQTHTRYTHTQEDILSGRLADKLEALCWLCHAPSAMYCLSSSC